jgi:hypothetical protein
MKLRIVSADIPRKTPVTKLTKPVVLPSRTKKSVPAIEDLSKEPSQPEPSKKEPAKSEPKKEEEKKPESKKEEEKPEPKKKTRKPRTKAKPEDKALTPPQGEPATMTIEDVPAQPAEKAIALPKVPDKDLVDLSSPAQMALSLGLVADALIENAKSIIETVNSLPSEELAKDPAKAKVQLETIFKPINLLLHQFKEVTDALGSQA